MMIFVDTWGWLALRDSKEARHQEVATKYHELRTSNAKLVTTDYVLVETYTLLFRRLPFDLAKESLEMLDKAARKAIVNLEWITCERFTKTQQLRMKFHDKPRISFTDLSSMVVMNELGIKYIFTEDAHFTHVGMGFEVLP